MSTKLQNSIMRRVYYTFGLRIATHAITFHVLVLAVAVYALATLVHVDRVLQNFAATPAGELGSKLIHVVTHADTGSVLVAGVIIFTLLSLPLRLPHYRRVQTVS